MRLRLLMRRLTVSAPRMAVRSALPWPFRWAVLAIVAGFCAAIALWAFEFGKDIAGLEKGNKAQLLQVRLENESLRAQLSTLKDEHHKAQSVANTAATLLTAEKTSQERLAESNRQLDADNQRLRSDLGFFEQLIPASGAAGISIRGLQAGLQKNGELKWQVLMIHALKNPAEFKGQLELTFAGLENGKPWIGKLPAGAQPVVIKQYGRLEGLYAVPVNVVIKSVTAKVFEGQTVRAVQTLKL
ncbi:MAG: hypothetical protein PHQ58_06890 [Rhodoferax sp.]|uniref:DUF6776 family protein n=1 Tax=Rhodoferax sp. TaxID=50421 RepID=UPI002609BFC5|nr:DUF6776 family protein [Rhodoferax sp.]MDD2880146.1 hypothetical protein [Rhodoferax sp.]